MKLIYFKLWNNQNGMTFIELLITLSLISSLIPCIALILKSIANHTIFPNYVEDYNALSQMQLILAQSENIHVGLNHLSMEYQGNKIQLVQKEDKLVKEKGYEVLLQDIDEIHFYEKQECIFMHVMKRKYAYETNLGCR